MNDVTSLIYDFIILFSDLDKIKVVVHCTDTVTQKERYKKNPLMYNQSLFYF